MLFIYGIPFNFYAILAVLMVGCDRRQPVARFWSMKRAEIRAQKKASSWPMVGSR